MSCVQEELFSLVDNKVSNFYSTGFADFTGDGLKDLVITGCMGDVRCNNGTFKYFENAREPGPGTTKSAANPSFHHKTTSTPFDDITINNNDIMAFSDIDSDGDVDMLITVKRNASQSLRLYRNVAKLGTEAKFTLMSGENDPFVNVKDLNSPIAAFGDCDNDGDPALVIGLKSTWNNFRLLYFKNLRVENGVDKDNTWVSFTQLTAPRPLDSPPYAGNPFYDFNSLGSVGSLAPTLGDVDNDGDVDLIVGVAGSIANSVASIERKDSLMYMENTGSAINPTWSTSIHIICVIYHSKK